MKKLLLVLTLLFTAFCTYAQDFSALQKVEYKEKTEYKAYESQILESANYILSVPVDDNNPNRQAALKALVTWMSGTPDYKFMVDETAAKLMHKNDAVLGIYFAAMTKYVLENSDKASDNNEIKLNAVTLLLDYCEVKSNKMKLNKELKKAIAAKNGGKLKEYLNI
ncbi:hypothetical protein [Cesiribacter sp. SM1]|uniref:hypothetical protein n=1 Tax=Cesiribacter sp. SM1 TaxID=2861196 RepID=UPI001CD4B02B|nr:hypothetical protein [Cesiribacter sp. SM1]